MTSPGAGQHGPAGPAPRPGRRKAAFVLVIGALLAAIALLARPHAGGQPLDPKGTGPTGVKALVLLLRQVGGDVTVSAREPTSATSTVVLLEDTLDPARAGAIERWVRAGGTLVVADPSSSLAGAEIDEKSSLHLARLDSDATLHPGCGLAALAGADTAKVSDLAAFFKVPADEPAVRACYVTGGGGAYLLARPLGRGTVIALAGAGPFTNHDLGKADNAVLAVDLLVPSPGTRVEVLSDLASDATAPPRTHTSVWRALPRRWQVALLQLLAVFLAVCLWRARRLGRPVIEDQPVEIPGSELVVAVGDLYQVGQRRQQAAANLVADTRRSLADRLGLPADTPPQVLAQVAAARTGIETDRVMMAVTPPLPATDDDLLTIAQNGALVHQEIARAR